MYKISFEKPIHVHFMGIGGISMSGLAHILLQRGFVISGSDSKQSPLTDALTAAGATCFYSQVAANITNDIDLLVYSAAIHPDNPEYMAAVAAGIPTITRAELLGQIMENYEKSVAVSGTHGKTTTTSMISHILLAADTDPTISVGGILKAIDGNIRIGKSDVFLTEACEYTNSFHSFYPKYNVILNIEEDHMDFFKDLAQIRDSFRRFATNTKSDGVIVINSQIDNWNEITSGLQAEILTFGNDNNSDAYPKDVEYDKSTGCASFIPVIKGQELPLVTLNVPGEHNVYNALASILITTSMGIDTTSIIRGLEAFGGTDRRFQRKGTLGGVTIIDDYAHHPTEISATLSAARKIVEGRLIVVFQPHTYTRTVAFMSEFAKALSAADIVVLADIYAARETDNLGISSANLQQEIAKLGTECVYLPSFDEIESYLLKKCIDKDLLITMGAGNVVEIGNHLLGL